MSRLTETEKLEAMPAQIFVLSYLHNAFQILPLDRDLATNLSHFILHSHVNLWLPGT